MTSLYHERRGQTSASLNGPMAAIDLRLAILYLRFLLSHPRTSGAAMTPVRTPLVSCAFLLLAAPAFADPFDSYVNPVLTKVPTAKGVKELKQLTPDDITDNDRVLPRTSAAFIVVRTNDGRYSKLLVQSARQKLDGEKRIPILYIERFVTYREGEERTVQTSGEKLSLFPGFRLSLDLGQVVPEELGGDLRFVADGGKVYAEPLGKARLYLLTKPLPEAAPKKGGKFVMGEAFEPRYFNGTFKLYDDGRRSGTLKLKVGDGGEVTGDYYSDKDGTKYEVKGRVGSPAYAITFTVVFPRSEEVFQGWMFTGDGRALAGSARLEGRETGFYAVRT